jgi:tetratricopeptide (TPR) repeat protein
MGCRGRCGAVSRRHQRSKPAARRAAGIGGRLPRTRRAEAASRRSYRGLRTSLYFNRGRAWFEKHDAARALVDLDEAIHLHPTLGEACNLRAWLRATVANGEYRDGRLALDDARRACDLSWWRNWIYLDTLAAAYAESGDYPAAVRWQVKATELLGDNSHAEYRGLESRLELYRNGRPFCEGAR